MDDVVRGWMFDNGAQDGSYIQPAYVEVDCSNDPIAVWVVFGPSGAVTGIAQPPVGGSLSSWPSAVYLARQGAQR